MDGYIYATVPLAHASQVGSQLPRPRFLGVADHKTVVASVIAPTPWYRHINVNYSKDPFIATQLNSTSSWVELRRRALRPELSSYVGVAIDTSPTQLNSTRRRVELSCVAINEP